MDWLTFIAEIVKGAAWPTVVLVALLVFRPELAALLGRLKKGKIAGAEFEFEDAVDELRAAATPAIAKVEVIPISLDNPRATVLEAWLKVEDAARKLAFAKGIPPSMTSVRPPALIKAIEEKGGLTTEQIELFRELRRLRNESAHSGDFSPSAESVVNYVSLAHGLAAAIERLTNH